MSGLRRRLLPVVENLARSYSTNDNPFKRVYKIFKDDLLDAKNFIQGKEALKRPSIFPTHCDVLIIGGGVMGSSVAYWLKQRALDGLRVVVVEKDLTVIENNPDSFKYRDSTSVLSVGGLRQQFSLKENVELSMASAEFLRGIEYHLAVEGQDPPDVGFNPAGYLFLAPQASAHVLEENVKLQRSLGAKVELLSESKLKEKFPWINTQDIALASHGLANEGWFDPWSLLFAFKRKACSLGAEYIQGEVVGFTLKEGTTDIITETAGTEPYKHIEQAIVELKDGSRRGIKFGLCVIAGGPDSGRIGTLAGMGSSRLGPLSAPLPVEPRKRYVYGIHCPDGPGITSPLLIDSSGTYFRREGLGGLYLCGRSPATDAEEPDVSDLSVDYEFFENQVWPLLAHRVPCFNNAKLKSAWAGYYDFNKFDENAILGPHPAFYNIYLATGFSGHGIQQAAGVGRALMELIIDGAYITIDLSRFHFDRILDDKPLWESNIV